MHSLPMTSLGYTALQQEIKDRLHVTRPKLIERLRQAMTDDVNLTENSEYQAAVADQAANDSRIAELEEKLARAEVIDVSKQGGDVVRFGATVTVVDEDTDAQFTWQIVGEPEADPSQGRISVSSPTARALMGKRPGAFVEVRVPAGIRSYTLQKVQWLDVIGRA